MSADRPESPMQEDLFGVEPMTAELNATLGVLRALAEAVELAARDLA